MVCDRRGTGSHHFFLEADRGTMAHSRMREKISALMW
jgi:hypothetical protein